MASTKRPRSYMEDEEGSQKRLTVSLSRFTENEDSNNYGLQDPWNAPGSLPPTRPESESVCTMFSVDGDGSTPMTEVLNNTPNRMEMDSYNSVEDTTSTSEGCKESEVCFGALFNAQVICANGFGLDKPSFAVVLKRVKALERYPVLPKQGYYVLRSSSGKDFAVLDIHTTKSLKAVQDLRNVRFQAVVQCNDRPTRGADKMRKRDMIEVSINIYGTQNLGKRVGITLNRERHFLQHPDVVDPGIDYDNPHYFRTPGQTVDLNQSVKPSHHEGISAEEISSEVGKIIDSLCVVDSDFHIPASDVLLTSLMSHQEAALKFIRQKESRQLSTSLWRQKEGFGTRVFEHQISGHIQTTPPFISAGGILADVMGLGKTLAVLSAMVYSMDEASRSTLPSSEMPAYDRFSYPTKATLVVVPSAQVIEVWKSEIAHHVAKDYLEIHIFHGNNRANEPRAFVGLDLVLTTYSTVVKDRQNAGILHRLKWFRVVLDEAHWIRNQETEQFRAVYTLQADRRWCLTGTPIQNRLEDLGALIRFLKVEAFDGDPSNAAFKRHIVDPIFSNDRDPYGNLRRLLRSVCLRRLKQDQSNLTSKCELVTLSLSPTERSLYDKTLEQTRKELDMLASTGSLIQKYAKLFTLILRLRMLCDQGHFCKGLSSPSSSTDMPRTWRSTDFRRGDDLGCNICRNDESLDLIKDLTFCPSCSRVLPCLNPEALGSIAESQGPSESPFSSPDNEARGVTPRLAQSQRPFLDVNVSGNDSNEYPTKLFAVSDNLQDHISHSKSIVFSYWTRTLDILGQLLNERQLKFVRIDGNVSYVERMKRLAVFQESAQVSILLMTLGTGAVGLNLTQANRIHIIEPQWNPSVEAQAIGRALRLGQTREVTVVRYVMDRTVEQNILEFQKRKEKLANFVFKGGLEESLSEKLQELRFILHVSW